MRRIGSGFFAFAVAFSAVQALSGTAFAQDSAPPPQNPPPSDPPPPAVARAEASGSVDTRAGATGGGAMTLPEREHRARAYAGDSDHDAVVGTLGIGYLGRRSMQVGTNTGPQEINAPVIGIRYWLSPLLGIDAGLGFAINSQSASVDPGGDVPAPSSNAFILHGGIPLALASDGHFTFLVVPELNFGFSSFSLDQAGGGSFSGSGFHFDIGARAGAEIHFGFIGLPKLSLQGTVGLALASDSTKIENGGQTNKASQFTFGTSVQDSPWNIFTSNVAALYYF